MRSTPQPVWIGLITAYQVCMPLLGALVLFGLASVAWRPLIGDSIWLDLIVRFILWAYTTWMYWSVGASLKHRPFKVWPEHVGSHRDAPTLFTRLMGGILFGGFLGLMTRWSLTAFAGSIPPVWRDALALANGVTFGALQFATYFRLPAPADD